MVSFLRQIKSDHSAEYVYLRGGRTACTAHSPFSFTSPRIDLLRDGNVWVRIAPNLGASFRGMVRNGVSRAVPCDMLNASGEKVFLGSRSNAAFCSPRCKNHYNVSKSRSKKDGDNEIK